VESVELIAILQEVRDRVRARYPATSAGAPGMALPDLEPLVRARDAALAKVAAIGTVNPRRGGPLNALVQGWKRLVARLLDWHVREQVLFNRKAMDVADAAIEALAATNRALVAAGGAISGLQSQLGALDRVAVRMRDEMEQLRAELTGRIDAQIEAQTQAQIQAQKGLAVRIGKEMEDLRSDFRGRWLEVEEFRAGFRAHWPEIEKFRSEFRARWAEIEEFRTAFRAHWPEIEEFRSEFRAHWPEIEKFRSEFRARWAEIEEFRAAFRLHWPEIEEFRSEFLAHWPEMKDIRTHWTEWRQGWEHKLAQNEIQFLRSVADLQSASSYRADLMDSNYRDALRAQHADFTAALARAGTDIQKQLLAGMERVKLDYERLIHTELRLIRRRAAPAVWTPPAAGEPADAAPLDYTRFAERFRGPEERVKEGQRFYLDCFAGKREVLDIGCGRGEFLELMREAGIPAVGIDLSAECVSMCREKGLDARPADLFAYLGDQPEGSLDGVFCAHVVEHLPPVRLARMIQLCATRLARGGVIAIETPNPECLAIFATYFYLDPTHVRPVPGQLLEFHFSENGLGVMEYRRLSPAVDGMPALASLPEDFREAFFGGLDYALIGRKL
jgi:O-antigen chain-terminating methyltransferase